MLKSSSASRSLINLAVDSSDVELSATAAVSVSVPTGPAGLVSGTGAKGVVSSGVAEGSGRETFSETDAKEIFSISFALTPS